MQEDGVNANSAMLCAQSRWCVAAAAAAATRAAVLAMPPPDHRNTAIDHRTPPHLVLCSDPGARLAAGSARRSRSAPGARAPLQCGGLQRCGSGVQRAAALRRAAVGVCSNQAPPTHLPHTPPWLGAGVRCGPLSGPRPSGATPPFTCFQRGRRASARSRCDADKQPRPTIAPHAAPRARARGKPLLRLLAGEPAGIPQGFPAGDFVTRCNQQTDAASMVQQQRQRAEPSRRVLQKDNLRGCEAAAGGRRSPKATEL